MADSAPGPFKYGAFLSYRTSDAALAEWLHRTLETYKVPRDLVGTPGDYGPIPARIGKVFRDRDESRSAADIEAVISHELAQSQQLVVLCSPAAASPESWVTREIELFRTKRPEGPIHAAIGGGSPPACFPPPLLVHRPDGRLDAPLAADLRRTREGGIDGRTKGAVRLIASLLGVSFDRLWQRERRRQARRRVFLAAQVAIVALASWGAILLAAYYRTHAMLDVDLKDLATIASDIEVITTQETPELNESKQIGRQVAGGTRVRLVIPAADVIVRIQARFHDKAARTFAWHVVLTEGWAPADKQLQWTLPVGHQIQSHPGMAYVPSTRWVRGQDFERVAETPPFWIDIRPPTTEEYLPVAQRLVDSGVLPVDESQLLMTLRRHKAIQATGLGQVHALNRDLGAIFGVMSQATSPTVSAPGDVVNGLAALPCDNCPAVMTRREADLFCQARGVRVPTASEWELAVRGVDGRNYPWGNRFDQRRANVPGLRQKGAEPPALASVYAHATERSPFGLIDTVGNAGDWVDTEGGYARAYMGATYRYNPEDATTFRLLPVTDSDYLFQEITTRCVAPG